VSRELYEEIQRSKGEIAQGQYVENAAVEKGIIQWLGMGISLEDSNLVLQRIRMSLEDPARMLDWDEALKN